MWRYGAIFNGLMSLQTVFDFSHREAIDIDTYTRSCDRVFPEADEAHR